AAKSATSSSAHSTSATSASSAGKTGINVDCCKCNDECRCNACRLFDFHFGLLFVEFGDMDRFCVRTRPECKVRRYERRRGIPGKSRLIERMCRVGPVCNDQLARERPFASLNPNFPIAIGFAKGVVIGGEAVDGCRPDQVGGLQALGSLYRGIAPKEHIFQRNLNPI